MTYDELVAAVEALQKEIAALRARIAELEGLNQPISCEPTYRG